MGTQRDDDCIALGNTFLYSLTPIAPWPQLTLITPNFDACGCKLELRQLGEHVILLGIAQEYLWHDRLLRAKAPAVFGAA